MYPKLITVAVEGITYLKNLLLQGNIMKLKR